MEVQVKLKGKKQMKTDKAVDVKKVTKKFGDFKVLDEISFDVLEGSVFGFFERTEFLSPFLSYKGF